MSLECAAASIVIGLSSIVLFVSIVSFVIIPIWDRLLDKIDEKRDRNHEN